MEDADFSDDFCRFVRTHVPSVRALEVLLLLYRHPASALPAADAATAAAARKVLESADPEIQAHLRTLSQADEERPVTLIRLIYALRDGKIRSFADAFKLRKP